MWIYLAGAALALAALMLMWSFVMQKRIVRLETGQQQLRNQIYQVLNQERHGRIVYPDSAPRLTPPTVPPRINTAATAASTASQRQSQSVRPQPASPSNIMPLVDSQQSRPKPVPAERVPPQPVPVVVAPPPPEDALPHEFCQGFLAMMANLPRQRLSPDIVSPHFSNDELAYLLEHFGGGNTISNPADIAILAEAIYGHNSWESVIQAPPHRAMIRDGLGPFLQTAWELVEHKRGLDLAQSGSASEEESVEKAGETGESGLMGATIGGAVEAEQVPPEPVSAGQIPSSNWSPLSEAHAEPVPEPSRLVDASPSAATPPRENMPTDGSVIHPTNMVDVSRPTLIPLPSVRVAIKPVPKVAPILKKRVMAAAR